MKTPAIKNLETRFGFHTAPFSRELAIARRFHLDFFDEAINGLRGSIEHRESCALIAPAGTGKTCTIRAVRDLLPEQRYAITYCKVSNLSRRDMCRQIAAGLGLEAAGSFPTLVRRLDQRLQATYASDARRPVLVFDDAHETRAEVLGILKVLTNFDMDSQLVTSVVLVGQKGLATLLARAELEDVARRLTHVATLRNLSRDETKRYIDHRCTDAGATQLPFDATAVEAIFEIGQGNLRATDRLALKSLEIGHSQDQAIVDSTHIVAARKYLWS